MPIELNLNFPRPDLVVVRLGAEETPTLPFIAPLTAKDRADLRWYVEVYAAHSLGDPDDHEAARIRDRLPTWGKALFEAVFGDPAAARLFDAFQAREADTRLVTISAGHPQVLALPWELLHESQQPDGVHLFHRNISVRRRPQAAPAPRTPLPLAAKPQAHLLFVVSRPAQAGFIDPRADARAVLNALDEFAPGRVTTEFLYPPTLNALLGRLADSERPAVDILHFDGHGVFDASGQFGEPNTGYLLFERSGQPHRAPSQALAAALREHRVALTILSACQSATLDEDQADPFGSVAAGLLAAGVPAVLAMTHSVLAATTEALFGAFYGALARGMAVGQALDAARGHLQGHPEKATVRRGSEWVGLRLHDWFVPTLYQTSQDGPLLNAAAPAQARGQPPGAAGFYGRAYELWRIERSFAAGVRRVAITGFGGQGKTALALEAGRWLARTGMFRAAAFVDYARIQTLDTVAVALSDLGMALNRSFPEAADATAALAETPTLVILDNLEALAPEPLRELLDVAAAWSEAGGSRVLLTARLPDFVHPAYPAEGGTVFRRVPLGGLGSREYPDDALEWFGRLQRLPPEPESPAPTREALVGLFERVGFHPLSIRVLATQLKTRAVAELGERLESLLAEPGQAESEDIPLGLRASLELSLDRLDAEARAWLPRLGVFQGGVFESMLLSITKINTDRWVILKQALEATALIKVENLHEPFLRFHPALTGFLSHRLEKNELNELIKAYLHSYAILASYLYSSDSQSPLVTRAIAQYEMPNLLCAINIASDTSSPEFIEFFYNLGLFLSIFGFRKEQAALLMLSEQQKKHNADDNWLTWFQAQSTAGEQLMDVGRFGEAADIFHELLQKLDSSSSNELAITMMRLGRCLSMEGQPDESVRLQEQALDVLDRLESDDNVRRLRGNCYAELGTAVESMGYYDRAKQFYLASLRIFEELNDNQRLGAIYGQGNRMKEGLTDEGFKGEIMGICLDVDNEPVGSPRKESAAGPSRRPGRPAHAPIAA